MNRIGDLPPWEATRSANAAALARAAIREAQRREAARRERNAKSKSLTIPQRDRRARKETPKLGRLPLTGKEHRDLCGRQFGNVTAIEPAFRLRTKNGWIMYWRCRCGLCGKLFDTQRQGLLCRPIRSCGSKGCQSHARKETWAAKSESEAK